jgi:hypothetical protein
MGNRQGEILQRFINTTRIVTTLIVAVYSNICASILPS